MGDTGSVLLPRTKNEVPSGRVAGVYAVLWEVTR